MDKLNGKIALVTGGNSGIGLATAKEFVNEGAYVFITGRREPELAAAVKEIGRNVTGVQGDVSNLGDLDRLFAQIKREKGKLDIVFANAGVAKFAPFGTITEEFYDSIFNINVKGLLFTVQKALPLLPDGASITSPRREHPARGRDPQPVRGGQAELDRGPDDRPAAPGAGRGRGRRTLPDRRCRPEPPDVRRNRARTLRPLGSRDPVRANLRTGLAGGAGSPDPPGRGSQCGD